MIKSARPIQVKWTLVWQSMLSGKKQVVPFIFYCLLPDASLASCPPMAPISPAGHKLIATLLFYISKIGSSHWHKISVDTSQGPFPSKLAKLRTKITSFQNEA